MGTAPGWEKWNAPYKRSMTPVFDWLLDEAGAAPGMRVLDIACGAGLPAIPGAERVAPNGRVVAVDADPELLDATRRLAQAAGVDNLEVRRMDMHELHFEDASFDAVTFGFALMFSPDPVKVMREVRRVLRPGGRVALCAWDEPSQNPFFTTMFGAVAELSPQPAAPPGAPGPFRLSPPGELARVLGEAGFDAIKVEAVPVLMSFESIDHHYEMNCDMAAPLKNLAERLDDAGRARLRQRLAAAIAPYAGPDGVHVPATPLAASALRPG